MKNTKILKEEKLKNNYRKEDEMSRTTLPFTNIENQRIWSIVVGLFSIFLVFYTPSFININLGILIITNNLLGIIIFLIAIFYFLKTLN